jgi:hypothetical protein
VDADSGTREQLADTLRDQLADVRLDVSGQASVTGTDMTDPGTMDWRGKATISVWPDEELDDDTAPWWEHSDAALSAADIDGGGRRLTILQANGLTVDLWHVEDVYNALDARSQDYADFLPAFGDHGRYGQVDLAAELEARLEPGGSRVVILDRVRLAPAWRGLGGVGRLLTARLLRWVADEPRVILLRPFPIELDDNEVGDSAVFDEALARVRRTWQSLAFESFTEDIWFLDPRMAAHDQSVRKIAKRLSLR